MHLSMLNDIISVGRGPSCVTQAGMGSFVTVVRSVTW